MSDIHGHLLDETLMNKIPHHTSLQRGTYSSTWGTPADLLGYVRGLFGRIDLDLASSAEHNTVVQAKRFYTAEDPCPAVLRYPVGKVLWCNPPGPLTEVRKFWETWRSAMVAGAKGAFLVFNIDHWRGLTQPSFTTQVQVLRRRQRYRGAGSRGTTSFASVLVIRGAGPDPAWGHVVSW